MIRSAVRTTLRSLLWSDLVTELNQTGRYRCEDDGFNDGRVELFQQLLRRGELPQLAKEVQPLLGLFSLCDCPTSGLGRWWCPGT